MRSSSGLNPTAFILSHLAMVPNRMTNLYIAVVVALSVCTLLLKTRAYFSSSKVNWNLHRVVLYNMLTVADVV